MDRRIFNAKSVTGLGPSAASETNSDIIPNPDLTYSLGTAALRWQNIFAANAIFTNLITGSGAVNGTLNINQVTDNLGNISGGTLIARNIQISEDLILDDLTVPGIFTAAGPTFIQGSMTVTGPATFSNLTVLMQSGDTYSIVGNFAVLGQANLRNISGISLAVSDVATTTLVATTSQIAQSSAEYLEFKFRLRGLDADNLYFQVTPADFLFRGGASLFHNNTQPSQATIISQNNNVGGKYFECRAGDTPTFSINEDNNGVNLGAPFFRITSPNILLTGTVSTTTFSAVNISASTLRVNAIQAYTPVLPTSKLDIIYPTVHFSDAVLIGSSLTAQSALIQNNLSAGSITTTNLSIPGTFNLTTLVATNLTVSNSITLPSQVSLSSLTASSTITSNLVSASQLKVNSVRTGFTAEIGGNVRIGTGTANGLLRLDGEQNAPSPSPKPTIFHKAGVGLGLISDYRIDFATDGATSPIVAMTIAQNQRVGIGLSEPTRILDVNGSSKIRGNLEVDSFTVLNQGVNFDINSFRCNNIRVPISNPQITRGICYRKIFFNNTGNIDYASQSINYASYNFPNVNEIVFQCTVQGDFGIAVVAWVTTFTTTAATVAIRTTDREDGGPPYQGRALPGTVAVFITITDVQNL